MLPENENVATKSKNNNTWRTDHNNKENNSSIKSNSSIKRNSNKNSIKNDSKTPHFLLNVEHSSKIVSEKYEHVVDTGHGISWIYYYRFILFFAHDLFFFRSLKFKGY